ncbi:MAG: hypothetical protein KAH99_05375 [Verrucomicrobia bacterium]|nr:hypothetical protein [Verrucomicrobiota bacterium]
MKHGFLLLVGSLFLFTACGGDEPASYRVPKQPAPEAPAQAIGSDADNQAVLAAHAAMSENIPAGAGFKAELPGGWTETLGSGMRKVSYSIEGTSIDFYLISLSMGDVPSNVNRWRGQIGLSPASPEEIEADVETFQADSHDLKYIEIYNEEGDRGIIAAILDLAPQYWYFTAKGPVGELKANATGIRKFLESIQINH